MEKPENDIVFKSPGFGKGANIGMFLHTRKGRKLASLMLKL